MRNLKLLIPNCRRIVSLILLLLLFCAAGNAQQPFSLPCKRYPAAVPFKCDAAVDHYWHVTSVKCLGPANSGYKFRISGRANKSHGRETIDLLYIKGTNSVSVAGAYSFPAIEEGKIFSFDIVSAFKGYAPARFNGFLIISRPMQEAFKQEQEAEQDKENDTNVAEKVKSSLTFTLPVTDDESAQPATELSSSVAKDDNIYDKVELMPLFPGGDQALFSYLAANLRYPAVAEENGVQGRVILSFIVETDGSLSGITVIKSVDPSLDKEAVRLVRNMPQWMPGKQNGKTVRVKYTIPVTFRLN